MPFTSHIIPHHIFLGNLLSSTLWSLGSDIIYLQRVAASCVWLASKLEESPRKARQVLIVFHRMECRRENLPVEHLDTSSKVKHKSSVMF